MPPKKKQQQIDLNSLPQCKSINAIILCKGKKARATNILTRIQKQAQKYLIKITKNQVLQHAKQKNIYVDPNTLTDKQKKDPKFMETVNTQLTAVVVAKAVQSLIATLNIKARIQKKNNPQFFADEKRKHDVIYAFEDFPQTKEQFEQIAKIGENIKYVLAVSPKISWSSAPDTTQVVAEASNQENQEEDQEIKEYRQLLKKQQKNEEDKQYETGVNKRIDAIKKLRSQSSTDSQFRNTTISELQSQIDPYNQDNSLNELITNFFDNINKLNSQFVEYYEWKKGKKGDSLPQSQASKEVKAKGTTIANLLDDIAQGIEQKNNSDAAPFNESQAMLNLISGFSTKRQRKQTNNEITQQNNQFKFIGANQWNGNTNNLQEEIRSFLKYPGINRHQMPQTPSKSSEIRKLQQSHFSLFLKNKIPLQEFFRRQRLLNFQEIIKDFDEERTYSFTDRIYEEHHNIQSLKRELSKATQLNQYSSFSKYDQSSDKLYLILMYRNNARRVAKKNWESNWKVLPNYEYWIKHFKNNQNNLSNIHYYDIDYEKIGNIEENVRAVTLKNGNSGAIVIAKQCKAANNTQHLLYSIKNDLLFGVRNNKFFAQNRNNKVYHHQTTKENQFETIIVQDSYRVRVFSNGNVLIENGQSKRIITPQGYTIIYGSQSNLILHPNGGVTYSKDTYINERGYGLKHGQLYRSQTLQRSAQNGQLIKRDDGTVIVQKQGQHYKWIKYFEETQYLVQGDSVSIEKKGFPFVVCKRKQVKVLLNQLEITLEPKQNYYQSIIQFKDGSSLRLQNGNIQIFQKDQKQQIWVNLDSNSIRSKFDAEQIQISSQKASLIRKGKSFDVYEDQQKYGEQDIIPADYIQPRLFVISNDGTGIELISEKTIENYLKQHSTEIEKVFENKSQKFTQVHIIGKASKQELKNIKNKLIINLDVFDNSKQIQRPLSTKTILLRTLLKYKPLSISEVADIVKIRNQVQVWRKSNLKEENEFGYRPRDQGVSKAKIEAKLLTIKTRQQSEPFVDSYILKQKARSEYLNTVYQTRQQQQQQMKKEALRKQYKKKRDTIIQEYKKLNLAGKKKSKIQDTSQIGKSFLDHYFLTLQGKKALSQMPEWVFRPKQRKEVPELDPQLRNQLNNTNLNKQEERSQEQRERYDTVQVNLNPRREKQIFIKPSVFTQRQIDEQRLAFEEEKKAYKFHQAKRKDFNVYGQQRKNMPEVRTLLRTQAISEINQKYLVTEAPLDKKVKISSMKNKLTSSASNMTQMRKEGPHSILMKTLDKGNDINKLLEKRTMMVQADLNDKLQRDVLISPVDASFGVILQKRTYELKIQVKNEDVISQRITIKRPKSIYVKVAVNQMGPIAMGMSRKILVTIKASSEILGKFTDQFDIVTKHEIYHIPISAHIVSENQTRNESLVLSKGVTEVEQAPKKKGESQLELPRLK